MKKPITQYLQVIINDSKNFSDLESSKFSKEIICSSHSLGEESIEVNHMNGNDIVGENSTIIKESPSTAHEQNLAKEFQIVKRKNSSKSPLRSTQGSKKGKPLELLEANRFEPLSTFPLEDSAYLELLTCSESSDQSEMDKVFSEEDVLSLKNADNQTLDFPVEENP